MKSETADEMFHGTVFPLMGLKKLPVSGHRVTVAAGRMDDDFLNTTGRNLTRVRNRVRLILCALLLILFFLLFAFVSCSPRQRKQTAIARFRRVVLCFPEPFGRFRPIKLSPRATKPFCSGSVTDRWEGLKIA